MTIIHYCVRMMVDVYSVWHFSLVSAVERDDVARLRQLLNQLSEEQRVQRHESSVILQLAKCLYIAAARGRVECARLLIDAGAQPNIRGDTNGNTPLVRI